MAGEIHKNHRARMRQRFLEHGLENFADHEVLELLLYYSIPRGDVNPLAHRLMDEFGTLAAVLDADPVDLCRVEGVGDTTAALLHLMPPLAQRYQLRQKSEKSYDTPDKIADYLIGYYTDKTQETALIFMMDNKCRLIRTSVVGQGSPNSVRLDYRKILKECLQYNASSIVMAHNHPDGDPNPSREDFVVTRRVKGYLEGIEVPMVDHIIVAGDRWVSMASNRALFGA